MIDGQSMEVEAPVLTPQQAVSPPAAAALSKKTLPSNATSTAKRRTARRKTLSDITNLSKFDLADATVPADESACPAAPARASAGGGGVEEFAELRKKNEELVRLLAERDGIIQLSGAEIQKLRLANWELARSRSEMMAEVNLGRNRLRALQHELACSRASLKVKTSELEDVKKTMPRRNAPVQRTQLHPGPDRACDASEAGSASTTSPSLDVKKTMPRRNAPVQRTQLHPGPDRAAHTKDGDVLDAGTQLHPGPDRAAHTKDGDVLDAEPASDASHARSGNASRKRVLRSRSLGPTTSAKLVLPKDKDKDRDASQRRKSMRTPQTSSRGEDLFEIEDVQRAISSCKIDPESASGSDKPGNQFLRRSSLGRPLRQARERVTTYKEMPLHVKLRRP